MAAPVVKGLIIGASVLVAAGIAFYENEQIREWIINYRRKLAIALYSLGDEIDPPNSFLGEDQDDHAAAVDSHRRRREEIIRLNRLEMVTRAREEGIAVDLDELVAIEKRYDESILSGARSTDSFDDIVGSDGMLRNVFEMGETTGASTVAQDGMRNRGAGARGLDTGSLYANPFDDEAHVLLDHQDWAQGSLQKSRQSSRTLSPAPLIDTSETQSQYFSEEELEAQIEEAIRRSLENVSESVPDSPAPIEEAIADPPVSTPQLADEESFYYAPPPNVHQTPISANSVYSSAIESTLEARLHEEDDGAHTPAGTLTPTEDGFSTCASMAGSGANDIGALSDLNEEAMSEGGYTTDYSLVGASTPGSWSDVGSEAGDEEGHHENAPITHS